MVSEILFSNYTNEKNFFVPELNLGSQAKYSEAEQINSPGNLMAKNSDATERWIPAHCKS